MTRKTGNLTRISAVAICLTMLVAFFTACAQTKSVKESKNELTESAGPTLITGIRTFEDAESVMVLVDANRHLTFTSVKQPSPLGVVLYFPETAFGNVQPELKVDGKTVELIRASELTDNGHTARIEIGLRKDVAHDVTRQDNGIKISFAKAASPASGVGQTDEAGAGDQIAKTEKTPADHELTAATRLRSIHASRLESGVRIDIQADGAIADYKAFTVDNPARIVFDLFNIKSNYKKEQLVPVNTAWVKDVRHFNYPDRLRLVLDTKSDYLGSYSAKPTETGLMIQVGSGYVIETQPGNSPQETAADAQPAPQTVKAGNAEPAWVNRIDFASEDAGKSTIIVGTTQPVNYNLKRADDGKLLLQLYNAKLPQYRQRPLITTRFKSAVDRITPLQTADMGKTALLAIDLREHVPYVMEQSGNLLLIHFEASSIAPKPLETADLPAWKKPFAQVADTPGSVPAAEKFAFKKATATDNTNLFRVKKVYTGEKIALDFYETDIKNVFRILREVSGKNYAIDKNVAGKVSLSLEKPVPWDQVLDLVLKMNQLGMVQEGEIIRIATMETIKKEQDLFQAKITAEHQSREKQQAMVPLVTEYIPINYAKAADVIKNLTEIKTKDRGSLTVDERTNIIIMSDVPAIVRQAKEIIHKLDKPTAQVVIEARIVEADSNFSREIGTKWSIDGGPISSNRLGGDYDYNTSVNLPIAASAGTMGFNFSRIAGSPFFISAELSAREVNGDLKIISSPKILTLDNQEAVIRQGVEFPYFEESESGGTTVKFKKIDLELTVVPHVTNDNRIAMSLKLSKNDIGDFVGGVPAINTKEANTELLVIDGETVVIGGINKSTRVGNETNVPLLSKIPVLSWLFKQTSDTERKEELLIFITPRVIRLEQAL